MNGQFDLSAMLSAPAQTAVQQIPHRLDHE